MSRARPAAGGGRRVAVPPERLERWLAGVAERHGPVTSASAGFADGAAAVVVACRDGTELTLSAPFDWVPEPALLDGFVAAAQQPRRAAVLLVRGGRWAAAVYEGATLVASKVDARLVQGRTAAGGWSQQRFARRRGEQSAAAVTAAGHTAGRVLLPAVDGLAALFSGGNRDLVGAVLAEPRLSPLAALRRDGWLDLGEPSKAALLSAPEQFRAVQVRIVDGVSGTERGARNS